MIRIEPTSLYRAGELENMLGRRGLARLRAEGGLRAVGDYYLGQNVIDSFSRVATMKSGSVSRHEKEDPIEEGHAREKQKVGQAGPNRSTKRLSKPEDGDSLRSQLEAFERQVRPAKVQRSLD